MKKEIFVLLLISILALTSFTKTRNFPILNYQTIDGKTITNEFLKGKSTIVIMAHLGCPPAMLLLKDLEAITLNKFQILVILENTEQQVHDFNSPEKNDWSGIRNYYKMKPLSNTIIAECETKKIKNADGHIIAGTQCRKLAKKIKTKDSPTLVYVNERGEITKIIKGYFGDSDQTERLR